MEFGDGLKLYKYDPVLDAEKPFDVELALNRNWDKVTDTLQSAVLEYRYTATYVVGDIVRYSGMLYVSLQDNNIDNTPAAGDWWKSYAGSGTSWIGTRAEYDADRAAGKIDDETICYITDDDGMDERIKKAIEEAVKKYIGTDPGGNDYEQLVNYTMLYDRGDECSSVTGGWTLATPRIENKGTPTKGSGYLKFYNTVQYQRSGAYTVKYIDLTKYVSVATKLSYTMGTATTGNEFTIASVNTGTEFIKDGDISSIPPFATIKNRNATNEIIKFDINFLEARKLTIRNNDGGTGYIYNIFAYKPDTWQPLCTKAGITPPAALDALLSDATAMTKIMTNADAINYMVKQCTGDFMVACCNSATAMSALVNNIAYDKAFENEHWRKFMLMCPVSLAAMDSVAVKVPTMTSNTTPATCSVITDATNPTEAYKVFDGIFTDANYFSLEGALPKYIGIEFMQGKIDLYKIIVTSRPVGRNIKNYELKYWSGDNWIAFATMDDIVQGTVPIILNNPIRSNKIILSCITGTDTEPALKELQFYGKAAT